MLLTSSCFALTTVERKNRFSPGFFLISAKTVASFEDGTFDAIERVAAHRPTTAAASQSVGFRCSRFAFFISPTSATSKASKSCEIRFLNHGDGVGPGGFIIFGIQAPLLGYEGIFGNSFYLHGFYVSSRFHGGTLRSLAQYATRSISVQNQIDPYPCRVSYAPRFIDAAIGSNLCFIFGFYDTASADHTTPD